MNYALFEPNSPYFNLVLFITLAPESRCPSKHTLTYEIKMAKSSDFKRFPKICNPNIEISWYLPDRNVRYHCNSLGLSLRAIRFEHATHEYVLYRELKSLLFYPNYGHSIF
jgi:hypothetical protein